MNRLAYDTKTTLEEELKLVPPIGWVVAGMALLFLWAVVIPLVLGTVPRKSGEPTWLLWIALPIASLVLAIWLLMVFYVNADAKRRQMNRLLWTLLVIFIPNAIGFIIYFVLRHPIARPCPNCRALVRSDFVFCPACGQGLRRACPACRRGVEDGWAACAFCGGKLA